MCARFYLEESARLEHRGGEALAARAQMALQHEVEKQWIVRADLAQDRRRFLLEEAERNQVIDGEDGHHARQRVIGAVEKARMPRILFQHARERRACAIALRHRRDVTEEMLLIPTLIHHAREELEAVGG